MGHHDRVDKTRANLALHVGTSATFSATVTSRATGRWARGMEGRGRRYLLRHVTIVDPRTGKPVVDRHTGRVTTVDHCWVSCPSIHRSRIPIPCTITFIATIIPYCKLNWKTGIGLAGIEIVSWTVVTGDTSLVKNKGEKPVHG